MCGIVAYIGPKRAYPVLIKGLQRLEYRGYDSAGVALKEQSGLHIHVGQLTVFQTRSMRIPIFHKQNRLPLSIMVLSKTILH